MLLDVHQSTYLVAKLCRLQDVLPLAVFKKGKDREAASEAALAS